MMRGASDLFHHLDEQQATFCRACLYAVWPAQVSAHLRGEHEVPRTEIRAIATEVATWGLQSSPETFRLLRTGLQTLDHLPVYTDDFACQLQPDQRKYVCRSPESLRNHWREIHQWCPSPSHRRGGCMLPAEREEYQRRYAHASRLVCCQRLFLEEQFIRQEEEKHVVR